ncbi:isocitrate dehydrogenase, NADP-dependent [Nautilia profundicola AmH]|uniref:Isocitrate dehydrogenase [NADP] n=1 Tax=Nautilia profundicola (strain ATCC BAA-1463 / DSM 18972 / AmH) TaxID=598659 RepID=B9L5J0_NAUPA|nr:NADP-dependent isocitrate dehydrogenase [Nautilia profundicola]ACM92706.1 isocitrate dehydrogenase, NADP-dependent [Nautilia profundicola AmH]
MANPTIVWTKIDEAPYLATFSLLPIMEAFTKDANINWELRDISLAGRVIAEFSDMLPENLRQFDELAYLGELVKKPEANVIKLPNISASVPQLVATIKELQSQGYPLPDFPEEPQNAEEEKIKLKYLKCVGSNVNPVLREGNSDRRLAEPVKNYAKMHPHSMKPVSPDSKSYVAHMEKRDFYETEQSFTSDKDQTVKIVFEDNAGNKKELKEVPVEAGEVFSAATLNVDELSKFFEKVINEAKEKDILFSLHVKGTMMKVSDPTFFDYAIRVYYKKLFDKFGKELEEIGFNPRNGLADLYSKLDKLPEEKKKAILDTIDEIYKEQPRQYMVDSDNGITNLHRPNDVIIDASIPATIKNGLKGWGPDGEVEDLVITVPDRTYARMYKEIVADIVKNGQFDPTKIGTVQNVGLMAKKAEEYGSHDKTFFAPTDGKFLVLDGEGKTLFTFEVGKGDVFRAYSAKDIAIKDWIRLAVERAKDSGLPIVFWLDSNRAHDAQLIRKVLKYMPEYDLEGVEYHIMAPEKAMRFTLRRFRNGEGTISVTGNVLRDYLTDLFPIIEVGTSARTLSIVPLLAGGGLYETGAGGSAPKHVEQFIKEGHLRWDSLGEFLATVESLKLARKQGANEKSEIIADALNRAVGKYLENDKTPKRKVGQLDNRGSHFYLAKYWAEELANCGDSELEAKFKPIAKELNANEEKILAEIAAAEGKPADIEGYFHPNEEKVAKYMRPSETFNKIIDALR